MDQASEIRLIRRAKRGEAEAFTGLIQEHQGRLFGFLFRTCGKRELCEDVVQESFVRVLKNIERFDERYRFSTWLFTIGRRLLINALQKNRPLSESEWVESWEAPGKHFIDDVHDREERALIALMLDDAMDVLSPIQKEVVVLYHHHGHPVGDISELLGMPAGTIKSHLHRARGRMRDWMRGDARTRSFVDQMLEEVA